MQRAMRDASNPMRRILEAARIERAQAAAKGGEGRADTPKKASITPPADAGPVVVPDTGIRVTIVPIVPPSAPPATTSAARAQPATPPAAAGPARSETSADAAAPTSRAPTLAASVAAAAPPAPTKVEASASDDRRPAAPVVSSAPVATPAPVAPPPAAPVLISMVEPVLTPQLMDRLPAGQALDVKLRVQADGSVSAVDILSPAAAQLARTIRAALMQWKFDAAPVERDHSVQLVFK